MHKGHLTDQFFIVRITFLDLLRDFVIFFLLFVQNNKSTQPNWQ